VLVNLLSNAVKFTSPGGEVRIGYRREVRDLVCWVRDTGIGIAPEDVDRIFEEFFQVDGSYSRSYGGTGLGLALVRRMLQMLGGRIELQSTPGEGSCFTIRIADCVLDEAPPEEREPVEAPAAPPADPTSPGRVIAVVEDNAVNRKLARNVLRSRGYAVVEATTGEEALAVLRRERVDLVLMDIQLPGMDGLEVTRRLKADPATSSIPIVALTAHAQQSDADRARDAGCVGTITKPIRLAAFPGQVEAYLAEAVASRAS
jgi:CheY-like chemotaxis protein